jgi:ATP-dependent RNA helicase SUPV3L1/SUV3
VTLITYTHSNIIYSIYEWSIEIFVLPIEIESAAFTMHRSGLSSIKRFPLRPGCVRNRYNRYLSSSAPQDRHEQDPEDSTSADAPLLRSEKDRLFFLEHGMSRHAYHEAKTEAAKAEKDRRRLLHLERERAAEARRHAARLEAQQAKKQASLQRQTRLQAHEETKMQKQQRILNTHRVLAAKAIPFWLGNSDSRAFDQTMAALNLKSRISVLSGSKKTKDGVLSEYRQLYLDSIASFLEKISADDRPDELNACLDKLTAVGFSDLAWAKTFRNHEKYQAQYNSYQMRIVGKRDRLQVRETMLEALRNELAKLHALAEACTDNDNDSNDKTEQTTAPPPNHADQEDFFVKAFGVLSGFLGIAKQEQQQSDIASMQSKPSKVMSGIEKEILQLEARISKTQENVDETKLHLESLLNQQTYLESPLREAEYLTANACIKEVLPIITQALAVHINERHSSMIEQYQTLDAKTDLTKPHEWYLHARMDRRRIIFHGGPTNSGKTYSALERLKQAKQGLYLGPLRLLAAEVYETLTSAGIYASLFTGQERREVPFSTHAAATVEMATMERDYDIVVIDEIQMIGDKYRGYAWTRALLGLRCKEIHICGGMEAESIVRKIAAFCGDDFELHKYERFSSLTVADSSIAETSGTKGSYRHVQPGDCVVAFSKNDIFAIKREIEETTDLKCCVIYGSLPPETRTEQARRFNNPDSEYKVLVASDAIGMGLNLNIRRIIFNSIYKSDGEAILRLDHSAIKQIAGRAGRRNSPFPNGEVTCRDPEDLKYIQKMINTEISPIEKAGLLPTAPHIAMFSAALEKYGLSKDFDKLDKILGQFSDMATVKGDFFLCRQTPMKVIARTLRDLRISIEDKYTLTMAPVQPQNVASMAVLRNFAIKLSTGQAAGLTKKMFPKPAKTFDDLGQLCSVHNELELFLWLHNRFPANANVVERQSAMAMKEQTINFINDGLASDSLKVDHCYILRDQRLRQAAKRNEDEKGDEIDRMLLETPGVA